MKMAGYIETAWGITHWRDYGGSGSPIVLVHGLGGSIPTWDAVGPALTGLGRVVALDLPGFGLSPPGNDWELETHAASITAFIDEFGHNATLIGNSMGALLAQMVAAENPDKVVALVLLSPATPPRLADGPQAPDPGHAGSRPCSRQKRGQQDEPRGDRPLVSRSGHP